MTRLILSRLAQMVPLLIGITFLTFAIVNLVPGSPLTGKEFTSRTSRNPRADIQRIEKNLGLDRPWYTRYFIWLGNVARGDLGISLRDSTSIRSRILAVLPNTLLLTGAALIFAMGLAVPLGVYSAVKRNGWLDNIVSVGAMAAYAVPSFWLAFLMVILFAVKFKQWGLPGLPVAGMYDLRGGGGFWDRVQHMIMPTIALGIVQLAGWTRYVRSSMLEVIRQDFVRTAEAKGLRNRSVLYGHAFRNAILPLVTLIGLSLPDLFGGAFIVESVFAWNGMGRLAVVAAQGKDYPMVMGTTLLFAVLTLLGNLIADILYSVFDPRIRYG